jgi:plastocyanin
MHTLLRMGIALASLAALQAADIHGIVTGSVRGTVTVERKLTPRNVTPAAGLYQRGAPVDLRPDSEQNPLDYERSHVVIYLEGDPPAGLVPAAAVMEQQNRRFSPDLVTIPAGGSVSFPNFDPIFHNVFSLSKVKNFDLGNYPKGQTRMVQFARPGVVFVYCHLHPNMAGTVVVTPNQWAARVDPSGKFTLADVPPGKYSIVAWHKTGGTFRKTVDVGAGLSAEADFFVPLAEIAGEGAHSHTGH